MVVAAVVAVAVVAVVVLVIVIVLVFCSCSCSFLPKGGGNSFSTLCPILMISFVGFHRSSRRAGTGEQRERERDANP